MEVMLMSKVRLFLTCNHNFDMVKTRDKTWIYLDINGNLV